MPFIPVLSEPLIVVAGPTASGKSALAQELAIELGGEIVSADSMQVYRGMDIGTGKVPPRERRVPHWGLDLVDPGEPYSVSLYQDYARRTIADIQERGNRPILCGGTGLYIRSVIDGYEYPKGAQTDNPVRERYTAVLHEIGAQSLWNQLNAEDPASAALIHPNNSKRVIRAFELLADGTSYAEQNAKLKHIPQVLPATFIVLQVERDALNRRIDQRVDTMFEEGLIEEVEGLLANGLRDAITAPQAIGYKEVVEALEGRYSMDKARQQVKQASHRYAKRQRSWFRADARAIWVDANPTAGLASRALRAIAGNAHHLTPPA